MSYQKKKKDRLWIGLALGCIFFVIAIIVMAEMVLVGIGIQTEVEKPSSEISKQQDDSFSVPEHEYEFIAGDQCYEGGIYSIIGTASDEEDGSIIVTWNTRNDDSGEELMKVLFKTDGTHEILYSMFKHTSVNPKSLREIVFSEEYIERYPEFDIKGSDVSLYDVMSVIQYSYIGDSSGSSTSSVIKDRYLRQASLSNSISSALDDMDYQVSYSIGGDTLFVYMGITKWKLYAIGGQNETVQSDS